jgi:hypothetical protein
MKNNMILLKVLRRVELERIPSRHPPTLGFDADKDLLRALTQGVLGWFG